VEQYIVGPRVDNGTRMNRKKKRKERRKAYLFRSTFQPTTAPGSLTNVPRPMEQILTHHLTITSITTQTTSRQDNMKDVEAQTEISLLDIMRVRDRAQAEAETKPKAEAEAKSLSQ
ncbi:hypothetical protein CHS0354_019374, partial [Potamilus streckersoni]